MVGYLAWGAWVSAHDPRWLYRSSAWWRVSLRPGADLTLVAVVVVWLIALAVYRQPRRHVPRTVGLTAVVVMVVVGAVLSAAAFTPCRGGQSRIAVVDWVLGLYVGNPTSVYGTGTCPGQPPLALQLGQTVCLLATLVGAVAAGAALWRQPWGRLRSRFVRDVTVFTGLDSLTMPLFRRLIRDERLSRIVVVEPDSSHPLLEEVRNTGVRVLVGDPTSARTLLPVLVGWWGCTLKSLYALHPAVPDNEAVLTAARKVLEDHLPHPERLPHLVARIDDPRQADFWRSRQRGRSSRWFEDALSAQESTALAVADQIFTSGAHRVLLCGDSTLALAIALELARRSWERAELVRAAAAGQAARAQAGEPGEAGSPTEALTPLRRVLLLDRRAADLRREYLATAPPSLIRALPVTLAAAGDWKERLLGELDRMKPAERSSTAVVIAETMSEPSVHEAGRVARLHPVVPVFVLTQATATPTEPIFDRLQPFQRTLLVNGEVPEDTWTRIARQWHECFRLEHPARPGDEQAARARLPWAALSDFYLEDNTLQLSSIMSKVVALGRRWIPVRAVLPGSVIELSQHDLEKIAQLEHTRWFQRRLAHGWSAAGTGPGALVNPRVVPWDELSEADQRRSVEALKSQLSQLEDIGFVPVSPTCGRG